ncbi:hypothetical protein KIN20_022506 [Parelaphostrongylus tenuis]|uniref:Uncharacterized protein n=1 Tax=Parelaphostrongylus tenuis TaxID=148309 RepID=A0AAD5N825_PARTN|nr:hypothetical protein KIN20_022506 [Parelaphostrongylus tenuis]
MKKGNQCGTSLRKSCTSSRWLQKRFWRDKNMPDRLSIYVYFAKLCKSYLDVADEESFKMCESMAKEAKFGGKGTLDDEQWKEACSAIDEIKKIISNAKHERELINDSN